ncbi:Phosphatidate cytidylyltransferase, mitochondrial [Lachnellula subtilissima]|uniref:Phosphatidate cytidylyltransferase, mitochondrial n=1 Tax=Lachnellula subtilissima TaxID=602034 RepID=A0A8H8U552_9HELO|nr:Phosphatidate cytidylyltransferase, mitochondrial [Lachnellula subtilissima]
MALRRPWQIVKSSRSPIRPGALTARYCPSIRVRNLSSQPSNTPSKPPADWEDNPNYNISKFADLPHSNFGVNQHIIINDEFKEALRQILWQFRAPIRYAFAYGSGVFPQSKPSVNPSSVTSVHPKPPLAVEKAQGGNPKGPLFCSWVTRIRSRHCCTRKMGAGVYFNPYVTVNGTLIKYGVVNLDTLCTDLSEWTTLYLAGRLHKPVKILRDDPRVRLANQVNLLAALRTALLLLPPSFTEQELYGTIASISYMGDPRMALPTEDPSKVANIVGNNLPNFRRLYSPLIDNLPNVQFNDPKCSDPEWVADESANVSLVQDMDPIKRGNMVRRLPKAFRSKVYFQYQKKFQIPQLEFNKMLEAASDEDATRINRREGGGFERRIASEPPEDLRSELRGVIKRTIGWPSTSQSIKSLFTAGIRKSWRYMGEKIANYQKGKRKVAEEAKAAAQKQKEQKDE